MKPTEKIFESSLRYPPGVTDPRILKALRRVLSLRAQGGAEPAAAVVTGKKLVVVCEYPERIKEVILMEIQNPGRVYERRSALKRKKNAPKT